MNEEECNALFVLAGIPFTRLHRLENKYWPDVSAYADIRRRSPWWLVITPFGPIQIGWRKNVISINWEDTPARQVITADDVTKGDDHVHAWSYAKALEYLTTLRGALRERASESERTTHE